MLPSGMIELSRRQWHERAWVLQLRITAFYALPRPTSPRGHRHPDATVPELVGGTEKRKITICEPAPDWPLSYRRHEQRIRSALNAQHLLRVEHIGSTSVPGLAAKPIIDILLVVPDITAEGDYLAPLIEAGYVLRVREPGHRMVRTPDRDVHVHILETGDPAIGEYLLLRDHLRNNASDRDLYARTKKDLAARDWPDINEYAEAKTIVITEIKARARQRDR